ncbi:la protein homolog isoform X1 [Bradysia coprophila]|uniref:la protein homolog isoform X1 n=1 Tax=Bradysia coprophila TaxID=38358 RepID=UPI00187D9448|nr:la protein homolog isoform X1 [Bradysia coprophila]
MADTENVTEVVVAEVKVDDVKEKEVALDAEPTIVPTPKVTKNLQAQIVRQVEYYFGDANLARDKFLSEEITKDNGWVTLELLLTFKRMQVLTTDPEVVCAALDTSDEGLIEISEDRKKIRRHPERPLPEQNEETRKECISRTAYVKGFPLDIEMSGLIEFFEAHEKVVNIVMRKYLDKPTKEYRFKGSVFVTFLKREQCEEFLKVEDLKHNDTVLTRLWQEDYYISKKGEREAEKQKKDEKLTPKINLPKGAVIFFEGCSEAMTRELIKEAVAKFADAEIAYIDYSKGDKSGYIRLTEENAAKTLIDKLDGNKLKLDDTDEATVRLIEGDEETEYLAKQVEQMISRRGNNFNKGKQGGRGRFHNRKRSAHNDNNDTPNKRSK